MTRLKLPRLFSIPVISKSVNVVVRATGGDYVSEPGNGYKYHTFISPNATGVNVEKVTAVQYSRSHRQQEIKTGINTIADVLIVAGGAPGGAGGGGAGGLRRLNIPLSPGPWQVTVGGAPGPSSFGAAPLNYRTTGGGALNSSGGSGGGFSGTAPPDGAGNCGPISGGAGNAGGFNPPEGSPGAGVGFNFICPSPRQQATNGGSGGPGIPRTGFESVNIGIPTHPGSYANGGSYPGGGTGGPGAVNTGSGGGSYGPPEAPGIPTTGGPGIVVVRYAQFGNTIPF